MRRSLAPLPFVAALAAVLAGCSSRAPRFEASLAPRTATPTVIRDVAVFVDAGTGSAAGRDVWIEGDRIARVVPTGSVAPPADALLIDGGGRTLLPGLIDAHVHVLGGDALPWEPALPDPEANLAAFLYAGVTTAVDLADRESELRELAERVEAGELAGPTLLYAGRALTAPGGHPVAMVDLIAPWPIDRIIAHRIAIEVEDDAEVKAAVATNAEGGASLIKLMLDDIPLDVPELSGELVASAVAAAHARELPVIVHVGTDRDARVAAERGADLLAHGVYRDAWSEETLALLAERGVPVVVTLGVFRSIDRLFEGGYQPVGYLDELQGSSDEALAAGPGDFSIEEMEAWRAALHSGSELLGPNARALGAHGVRWLVGSDSPTFGWSAGQAIHVEMDWLVEAGYAPAEVLEAATAANAAALGLDDRGRVAEGLRADLLLVDGDPTADIAALHRIVEVFRAGRRVERTRP